MKKIKETPPLSKFINTSSRTKYIIANKKEIHEQQLKRKFLRTRQLTQVDFKKFRDAQKKKQIENNKVGVIGVEEGLITLPDLKPTKNWKKMSKEEIETRNNQLLNQELMNTLVDEFEKLLSE